MLCEAGVCEEGCGEEGGVVLSTKKELPKFPKRKEMLEVIEFLDDYPFPLAKPDLLERINRLIKIITEEVDANEEFVAQLEDLKGEYEGAKKLGIRADAEIKLLEKVLEAFKSPRLN